MSNNKHINKEMLISKIDNNLEDKILMEVDYHLKECSRCLILYAQLKTGYLELEEINSFDKETISKLMMKSSICINLIGILFEKKQNQCYYQKL